MWVPSGGAGQTAYDVCYSPSRQRAFLVGPWQCDRGDTLHLTTPAGHRLSAAVVDDPHRHTLLAWLPPSASPPPPYVRVDDRLHTVSHPPAHTQQRRRWVSTVLANESPYVAPWVEHHLRLGFDQVVIYDNASLDRPALQSALAPFGDRVWLVRWDVPYRFPGDSISGQTAQQNHTLCVAPLGAEVLLTDCDEYLLRAGSPSGPLLPPGSAALTVCTLECGNPGRQAVPVGQSPVPRFPRCRSYVNADWHAPKLVVRAGGAVRLVSVHVVVNGPTPPVADPGGLVLLHYKFLNKQDGRGCEREGYPTTVTALLGRAFTGLTP